MKKHRGQALPLSAGTTKQARGFGSTCRILVDNRSFQVYHEVKHSGAGEDSAGLEKQ